MKKARDIDEYIASWPPDIRERLQRVRSTVAKAAPGAVEVISYGMPGFRLNGVLVWFAAHTRHIGFYPHASGIEAFRDELASYAHAKGSVQFPHDMPLPLRLISRIVKFRVREDRSKRKR